MPVPDAELDTRGLLARFTVGVLLLLGAVAVLGAVLREPVEQAARMWVDTTGLAGMFAAITVLDSIPSPIPPDLFTGFAYVGGLDFWTIAIVASAASVSGGTVAWAVARRFSQTAWFQRFIRDRGARAYALVQRYGMVALVLGAVSPLPFSLTCYAAGTLKMPYTRFLSVALLRAPRILFYLALIRLGWVGVEA
jgi:uncharacterized membrane protein YdjX (TVP38/TMEM64 family)